MCDVLLSISKVKIVTKIIYMKKQTNICFHIKLYNLIFIDSRLEYNTVSINYPNKKKKKKPSKYFEK